MRLIKTAYLPFENELSITYHVCQWLLVVITAGKVTWVMFGLPLATEFCVSLLNCVSCQAQLFLCLMSSGTSHKSNVQLSDHWEEAPYEFSTCGVGQIWRLDLSWLVCVIRATVWPLPPTVFSFLLLFKHSVFRKRNLSCAKERVLILMPLASEVNCKVLHNLR